MSRFTKIAAFVLIVLALILGVVAIRLARQPASPPPAPAAAPQAAAKPAPTYGVVVAVHAMGAGQTLGADDLRVVKWPVKVEGGYDATTALVDKRLRIDVAAGQPVLPSMLSRGLALSLNPGERAVTISVNRLISVQGRVEPGDYVDVFFSLTKSGEVGGTQVRLLLPHVRVLAYGDNSLDGPPPGVVKEVDKSDARNPNVRPVPPTDAVLAVPLDNVDALMLAAKQGALQLALRAPSDTGNPDPSLFVTPTHVLNARAGLDKTQLAELNDPANQAYAGTGLTQLAGPDPDKETKHVSATRRPSGGGASVEIIRGDKVSRLPY